MNTKLNKNRNENLNESWDYTKHKDIEKRNNDVNRYNIKAQETNPEYDNFFNSKGNETKKN